MTIQLMFDTPELPPGDYSLHPDEETRLVMMGLARRWSAALPQLHPPQLRALRTGRVMDGIGRSPFGPTDGDLSVTASAAAPLVRTGPCRLIAVRTQVLNPTGTFTVRDGIDPTGRIVLGPWPLSVSDTLRGDLPDPMTIGCYVQFSGAGSVRVELDIP